MLTFVIPIDQGIQAQDRDLNENAYRNNLQPYLAYWGCTWTLIFILINGFTVFFGKFNISVFIASCESFLVQGILVLD